MSLLNKVTQKESTSKSEVVNTTLTSLSGVINGKYGPYRIFQCPEGKFIVDESKISNAALFRPNSSASITVTEYTNSSGEEKVIISALQLHVPENYGLYFSK